MNKGLASENSGRPVTLVDDGAGRARRGTSDVMMIGEGDPLILPRREPDNAVLVGKIRRGRTRARDGWAGRDIVLSPPQHGEPLSYFVYPYAEARGKALEPPRAELRFRRMAPHETGADEVPR